MVHIASLFPYTYTPYICLDTEYRPQKHRPLVMGRPP